ncbi:ribonuclease YeeF family protein [Peribacillus sp. NPDC046944]|uniref:ribonuclease YeeF family protein n=1 Tax=unclassified Peribacillus TaxID=2675266 RepID=UPI00382BDEF0
MTIFEAKPLKSAVKSRAKQYEDLLGQVETLKKEFQGIVDLDEELAGAGATAIKNFYRAQVEVANAWIELFTTQISFLKGIPAILEDADLSGETVVEVPFLEGEVTHGLSNAKSMVNQQSTDLQKIFQNIDDILSLQVFDQGDFHEKMEKAEKEKNDTIKKVHEVDNKLVEEYQVTEAQESVAISLFQALLEATSQDGTVSPMNFNQSAFQASQAYQVKDEVAENMQGYRDFKKQEEEARKLEQEMEELENRPWYEKAWDTTKTFTGEITGYYDSVRATTGVDPVTGRKLSEAERIAAGAMAAAGFIPIVGWAGRAVKGGSAVYKTVKGLNAADHALDAYKSSKGLDVLKQTEYGLYGLTAANGLGEAVTGKDMFGNELTKEQRQNSLMNALGIAGVAGAAKVADKMASGTKFIPYSKEYVQKQVQKAQGSIKDMGKAIGKTEVPTGFKVREVADTTGSTHKIIEVDKTTIKDLAQKITAKGEGSNGKSGEKSSLTPGGGLAAHEVKGGHLIERHVGKTDEELLERIRNNPRINGSSTFKDRAIAEKVVSTALSEINNKNAIESWMSNSQSKSNLVLTYEGTEVIGRGVKRGSTNVENMTNARIILKKDGEGNYILTGYPN